MLYLWLMVNLKIREFVSAQNRNDFWFTFISRSAHSFVICNHDRSGFVLIASVKEMHSLCSPVLSYFLFLKVSGRMNGVWFIWKQENLYLCKSRTIIGLRLSQEVNILSLFVTKIDPVMFNCSKLFFRLSNITTCLYKCK